MMLKSPLSSPGSYTHRIVDLESRSFSLSVLRFDNGFVVSISEGSERIGAVTASLATGSAPVTTTVIPSRSESLLLRMVAERISTRTRGIALVSVNVTGALDAAMAKALMSSVVEMTE